MLSEQIVKLLGPGRDPGLATAAAGVLLVATVVLLAIAGRIVRFGRVFRVTRT